METDAEKKLHKKVFISYAWGTEEYSQKVTRLVNALRANSIDTIYDKFDLAEGADIHVFMEQAVNSKDVDKVLILCDKNYQEKANSRKGGVGKETLIISPEIYNDSDPIGKDKKFIPVIMELDEQGQPYIPTYLKSKLYLDYTHEDGAVLERLVRVIYGQPELVAPPLGKIPSYIIKPTDTPSLPSYYKLNDAISAIYEDKKNMNLFIHSAFEAVIEDLENVKVEYDANSDKVAENVIQRIEELRPLRNKLIELFNAIVISDYTEKASKEIRTLFEKLCNLAEAPIVVNGIMNEMQKNHLKFFIYEAYLYFIAILIENEKFDLIQNFISNYYVDMEYGSNKLITLSSKYSSLPIFTYMNSKNGSRRLSLQADWTCEHAGTCGITRDKLIQADFILFLTDTSEFRRNPSLIIFADKYQPLEIFGRATSKTYLKKIMSIFNFSTQDDFIKLQQNTEQWIDCRTLGWKSAAKLMNIEQLGTKP